MLASPAEGIGRGVSADDLVAYCEKIAAASGGMLGSRIASISKEERALLSRIAADLKGRQSQV
jgi:hypothetical protein